MRWAGHVARMDDARAPFAALFGQVQGGRPKRGGPLMTFERCARNAGNSCGLLCGGTDAEFLDWLKGVACDRAAFRGIVQGMSFVPRLPAAPTRVQPPRRCKRVVGS